MNKNPIGILDSGIGGLSIWQEIIKKLPHESVIYLADSKNCPYGEKTSKEIYDLSRKMIKFLLKKKVKLIVIACNTITVVCLDKLRLDFPQIPIIGTVPVVKTASKMSKNGRIGILSTNQTAKSEYQKDLIKKFSKNLKVLNLGTDKLVPIVESGEKDKIQISKILEEELKPFIDFKIDALALGCSHFPFLKREMQKVIGNKIKILDSSGAIARQTKRVILMEKLFSEYNKFNHSFYTTGDLKKFKAIPKEHLKLKDVKFEKIKL